MLRRMGLIVEAVEAPFEPEGGAYGGVSRRARSRPRSRARPAITARSRSRSRPRSCPRPRMRPRTTPDRAPVRARGPRSAGAAAADAPRVAGLPVGGFSYSEGLEAAVEHGLVRDEADTLAWLPTSCTSASCASRARRRRPRRRGLAARRPAPRSPRSTHWVSQTREARELRQQSEQMGRSLAHGCAISIRPSRAWPGSRRLQPAPSWPVAFALAGVAHRRAGARRSPLAFAAGWAENHGAGRAQGRAARPERRPARARAAWPPRFPAAVDDGARARRPAIARPSRRCSRSCRRSTKSSTRACSAPDRTDHAP